MQRIILIALNDLRVYFSDRGNLIGLVVLPVALTIMLGFISQGGGGATQIRVDLIDLDNTTESESLIDSLRHINETLIICPLDDCNLESLTVEESIERVQESDTQALIVIPEGYGESLIAGNPISIDYYAQSDGTGGFNDPVLGSLQTVTQRINAAIQASEVGTDVVLNFTVAGQSVPVFADETDQSQFAETLRTNAETLLSQQSETVNFVLTSGDEQAGDLSSGFGQAVPGQGATFVMFTVLGGMAVLMRERREWTLQRLFVLPLSRAQVLGGKILTFVTLGIIQFAVVFAVGVATGTNFGNAPLAMLLLMFAFVLATTSLAFAIATRLKSEEQAGAVSLLLSFTLAPLGGAWWPLDITPQLMQLLGRITPVAWVMDGFQDIIFYGGGITNILPEVGVLLVFTALFFTIGILGFQYE